MVLGLNHADVIIPRGQEEKAREFYCGFLGLTEIPKPASLGGRGGLWLQLGPVQVHLSIQDGYDPRQTKAHLAYEVADLAELRQALAQRGIEFKENIPVPGYIRGDIRDPFGNRIEFMQKI